MTFKEEEFLLVEKKEAGERLDKVLASRFGDFYSRTYFQTLIEEQLVLVNGQPAKKRIKLQEGDEIEIQFSYNKEISLIPEPIPMHILYEDDDIIVIDKQKGLVVHPAPGNWSQTFVNGLLFHCQAAAWDKESLGTLRPGIVHRLDKDTTGVLIAAKHPIAQRKLIEAFAKREVYKEYLAICAGNPGSKAVSTLIGRHPKNRQKMAILEAGGKPALSHVETLKTNGLVSLVKIEIATGRTHQIRVHLNHLKAPVLGDELYGNSSANQKYKCARQYLHASCLKLKHPMTRKEMVFEAHLPEDMQKFLEKYLTSP